MRLFGLEISWGRQEEKAAPAGAIAPAYGYSGWSQQPIAVHEPFTGAWQRNMELRMDSVLSNNALYACVTRIAQDIAKLPLLLVQKDRNGIWNEAESSAFSPVMRQPNNYQSQAEFIENWIVCKLTHGNTYVLKERDERKVVTSLYILDPQRTKTLVAPNGEVYYQLSGDNLSGTVEEGMVVPASEIIHDRMVPLYHPLCGVSPITAAGMAAMQGLAIQRQATGFFQNGGRPGGLLTAPGKITDADAARIKEYIQQNYSGSNAGRVLLVSDGMTFTTMTMNAVDAEVIEQLKMTAVQVCACYHVPPFMVGFGEMPKYDNIQAQIQQYYAHCLQNLIYRLETCLDNGLGLLSAGYGAMLDLDHLLLMDTQTLVNTMTAGVKGAIIKPDEARKKLNLPPEPGGDALYMQQQNYSLPALAKRDAKDDPFENNVSAYAERARA